MEQENINTFNRNVYEIGRSESFDDLRTYFDIVAPKTIIWKKHATKKVEDIVEYLAERYLS